MSYQLRPATQAELPLLRQFEQGIHQAEKPLDETLKSWPVQYYDLESLIASDDAEVVVATYNGQAVASGFGRIDSAKAYLKHDRQLYLGFMYVVPEHRGKGLNRLIIDHLKSWGRARGLNEMRLEVYDQNHSAIQAYEKAGFKKNLVEMRQPI